VGDADQVKRQADHADRVQHVGHRIAENPVERRRGEHRRQERDHQQTGGDLADDVRLPEPASDDPAGVTQCQCRDECDRREHDLGQEVCSAHY
jgi:hypothetical protein